MKDMQKMNTRTGVLLGISVGAAALLAAACGEKANNSNTPITPAQPTTVTPSTTVPSVTPPVTPTTPGVTPPVTPPTGSTTDTGATTPPAAEMSTCTTTTYADGNVGNDNANFSATRSIYVYGDGTTSACTDDATTVGTLCVEGNATDAMSDYKNWGAGIGLQLAETDSTGAVVMPWNAAALGITQLRFTASNLAGRKLRVQISRVDDPAIADAANNYQSNGFLWGGSSPKTAADGVNTIDLTLFKLPSWAKEKIETGLGAALADGADVLEASALHSLQFQVASDPGDATEKYSFCLSGVEWLDAAGAVVPVTVTETGSTGETGGSDTGAVDTASSGGSDSAPVSSAGSDSSAPVSSGEDTGGAVDVYPIFQAKCAGGACHGDGGPQPNKYGSATLATAQAAVDGNKVTVSGRVAAGTMPPAGATALTQEEKDAVAAWAAQ